MFLVAYFESWSFVTGPCPCCSTTTVSVMIELEGLFITKVPDCCFVVTDFCSYGPWVVIVLDSKMIGLETVLVSYTTGDRPLDSLMFCSFKIANYDSYSVI